jgi:hypothetical protein
MEMILKGMLAALHRELADIGPTLDSYAEYLDKARAALVVATVDAPEDRDELHPDSEEDGATWGEHLRYLEREAQILDSCYKEALARYDELLDDIAAITDQIKEIRKKEAREFRAKINSKHRSESGEGKMKTG